MTVGQRAPLSREESLLTGWMGTTSARGSTRTLALPQRTERRTSGEWPRWGSTSLTLGRWLFVLSSILTRKTWEMARRLHQEAGLPFLEVFVDNSMDECEKRDTKGPLGPL